MSRLLTVALALVCLGAPAVAQSAGRTAPSGEIALSRGVALVERAAHAEALEAFDAALDAYAGARQLEAAQRAYMRMFVGNRSHANLLMKAMKSWVQRRRPDSAGLAPMAFAAFDAWVQERDALAASTINLVHNSPDWK